MPLNWISCPDSAKHTVRGWLVVGISTLLITLLIGPVGCSKPAPRPSATRDLDQTAPDNQKEADLSALFIGNSHTGYHDVPKLVGEMMAFRHPETSVFARPLGVEFLEDAARDPSCKALIQSRNWNFVVLQAQKISMSGRYQYSTQEGIDLAKLAKSQGATVYYFSEWGRKGVAGEGERTHQIYDQMAQAADVGVAPVGRAWDIALSERPEMKLHSGDGNHQSEMGAFLTACVLCGQLTGESPASLASFDYPGLNAADRKFLAEAAARALK